MPQATTSTITERPASATSIATECKRLDQAIADLQMSEAASVSLIHCLDQRSEKKLGKELADRARERNCVTSAVSLEKHGLNSPETLVKAVLEGLTPPGETQKRGLLWILERFYDEHAGDSVEAFDKAAANYDAVGDFSALCRGYLGTDDPEPIPQLRAYKAWLNGEHPPDKYRNAQVWHPLTERNAQRVLAELTRVMRALGYAGTIVILGDGATLIDGTERQREKAYTVLRELVDNFDGNSGAMATRLILTGQDKLFYGKKSIQSIPPLQMRLSIPSDVQPVPPHRSLTSLQDGKLTEVKTRKVVAPKGKMASLSGLIRISEGLPPDQDVTKLSVGCEKIDRTISKLFNVVRRSGNFFTVLVGDYGSGKTHQMMHLAERALEDNRPVFWLNLERANIDLGNPARHLFRLLEHAQLPLRRRPNALALASRWTSSDKATKTLCTALTEISEGETEAAAAAVKGLRLANKAAENGEDKGLALQNFLSGLDLEVRSGNPNYRRDAYRRIFLWVELLAKIEGLSGPVILIDEAENLYSSGKSWATRRTALRSLSFYCSGSLPGACVILGMTPPAFEELKKESRKMLTEANKIESTLDLENVTRFKRAMAKLAPQPTHSLSRAERVELCTRIRKMHKAARGTGAFSGWDELVATLVKEHSSPRVLIRALVDRLESNWWQSS